MASKNRCPACGSSQVRVTYPPDCPYENSGLTGVHLIDKGVAETACAACGDVTTTVLQEAQLQQVLGMAIVLGGAGITGEQLRYLRKLFDLTQDELAQAIGKGRRETVAEWESREQARLFRVPYDELGLRVVLISLFHARIMQSEFCCLSSRHRSAFDHAAGAFVEQAASFARQANCKTPVLRVRRQGPLADWAPAPGIAG